jgi:ABC-2 type transport system ATP-binding protein
MALEVVGVGKGFGGRVVLDGVSLSLPRGEIYGFLGHNGSGKTTLMRIVLGLHRADAGRVLVDGIDAFAQPAEARARIAGLVEIPGAWERLTARENLVELGRLQGMDPARSRDEAERVLHEVGLDYAADRHAGSFSQGMRQRLGIGAALLGEPRYLLLDEPFNGLDPESLAHMRELLQGLARQGVGILLSSHQLAEIAPLTTRIGVLKQGRMIVEGGTHELLESGPRVLRIEGADDAAQRACEARGWKSSATPRGLLLPEAPRGDEVARVLLDAQAPFTSISRVERSLEDIYLAATRGEMVLPAAAAAQSEPPAAPIAPSRPWLRAFGHEWRRLAHTRALLWITLLPTLLGLARLWLRWSEGRAEAAKVEAGELATASGVNGFELVAWGMLTALPVLALLGAGIASQSIAGELSRHTLRNVLLRPLTRVQLVLGKLAACLAALSCGYLLLAVCLHAAAWGTSGFGDAVEILPNGQPFVMTAASELVPDLARAWWAPLPALCAALGLGFCAGSLVRSAAAALGTALGFLLLSDLGRVLTRGFDLDGVLPSDHMPSPLGDSSYPRAFLDLAQGISNVEVPAPQTGLLVGLAWLAASAAASVILVRRKAVP